MKTTPYMKVRVFLISLILLALPAVMHGQTEQTRPEPPPVGQPLVREGAFAVKMLFALAVGATEDEVEAESKLGEVGISPRNGWIADYPVTPDILGELQHAVSDAAEAKKLMMGKEEALKRFDDLSAEVGLGVRPYVADKTAEAKPPVAENYPNPTVINNYYYNQGPPTVTYYAPPPDYYYLYGWVPYPFWWSGFWFPGFFILHDFHRTVIVNQRVVFISNHFRDARIHRVFRIDPVARFGGRTFAGIGVSDRRGFISTGVPRSERTIFNGPRARTVPGGAVVVPRSRSGASVTPSSRSGRIAPAPTRGGRAATPSSRGGGGSSEKRERK